ncbi:MAG: hypothetical protein KGM16_20045 [Bacteroidota bacterium]|nr:hypothetical protein [Bacteroidota bacterium]
MGQEPPSQGAGDNPDNLWDDGGGGSGGGGGGGGGGFFSYMDANGNKWNHADPLGGTASAGMQYTEGYGWDGFGDTGNGGFVTHVHKGTLHGTEGYYYSYSEQGAAGDGHHILSEVKIERGFVAFADNYYYSQEGGQEGFENAKTIVEAGGLSWDMTKEGIIGAQKLGNLVSNTSYVIQDIGKLKLIKGITVEASGKLLAVAGLGITGYDIYENGLNWSNGTDAVFGIVGFVPGVGWIISGAYFIANTAVKNSTGKSIGDYIGDAIKNPISESGDQFQTQYPDF